MYPHGAVDIASPNSNNVFKVNGQRLKQFLEYFPKEEIEEELVDPIYVDEPNSETRKFFLMNVRLGDAKSMEDDIPLVLSRAQTELVKVRMRMK